MQACLMEAVKKGNITQVRLALDNKSQKVNEVENGSFKFSPLMEAGNLNHLEIARLLLVYKANPNYQTPTGRSALSMTKNPEIVKLLLVNNANPEIVNCLGNTILETAAGYPNSEVVNVLLQNNAQVNNNTETNTCTPLEMSIKYGNNPETVKLLLANKADVNRRDRNNKTPLLQAIKRNCQSEKENRRRLKTVRILLGNPHVKASDKEETIRFFTNKTSVYFTKKTSVYFSKKSILKKK